ncbi:MAG: hypothetical protein IPM29_29005 [Planctomycetes bacterium]|nr:hypothetical protein [Planctomycetota bacterium]
MTRGENPGRGSEPDGTGFEAVVRRVRAEERHLPITFAEAERRLRLAAGELPIEPAARDALVDRVVRGGRGTGFGGLLRLDRRRLTYGVCAAAAVATITVAVRLWPERRDPKHTLGLGTALLTLDDPGAAPELRQNAMLNVASVAMDAANLLVAESGAATPSGSQASFAIAYLRSVLREGTAARPVANDDLDDPDGGVLLARDLLSEAQVSPSERGVVIAALTAVASQAIRSLVDAAALTPELAVTQQAYRARLDRLLRPR